MSNGEVNALLAPAVRAEAQAILNRAARRLLAEQSARLDRNPISTPPTGGDDRSRDNRADERSPLFEREQVPVDLGVDNQGGSVTERR